MRQAKGRGLAYEYPSPHSRISTYTHKPPTGLGIAARVAPPPSLTSSTATKDGSNWLRVAVGNRRYMEEVEGLSSLTLTLSASSSSDISGSTTPVLRAVMPPPTPRTTEGSDGGGEGQPPPPLLLLSPADARAALEEGGKTVVYVAVARRMVGLLAVADRPRPEARETVAALHRMGVEVRA